jgi:hypothetical protein
VAIEYLSCFMNLQTNSSTPLNDISNKNTYLAQWHGSVRKAYSAKTSPCTVLPLIIRELNSWSNQVEPQKCPMQFTTSRGIT